MAASTDTQQCFLTTEQPVARPLTNPQGVSGDGGIN